MDVIRGMAVAVLLGPMVALAQPSGMPPRAGPQVQIPPQAHHQHTGQTPEERLPDLGPNVVIGPRPGQPMIQEYRVNDRVFMIKVTPLKGFSYYLMDTNGDGRLDTRRNALEPNLLVPGWPLLRWK